MLVEIGIKNISKHIYIQKQNKNSTNKYVKTVEPSSIELLTQCVSMASTTFGLCLAYNSVGVLIYTAASASAAAAAEQEELYGPDCTDNAAERSELGQLKQLTGRVSRYNKTCLHADIVVPYDEQAKVELLARHSLRPVVVAVACAVAT